MTENLHIEIVSDRPGEYRIYLMDPSNDLISLEGVTAEIALIDIAGNELETFPAQIADNGEYMFARGGLTHVSKADVRVRVIFPTNGQAVEMDFSLSYQD